MKRRLRLVKDPYLVLSAVEAVPTATLALNVLLGLSEFTLSTAH